MPRNVLVLVGVAFFIGAVLLLGLRLARTDEGRGADQAIPDATPNPEARDVDVRITDSGFEPRVLRVRTEEIVRWRNDSSTALRIETVPRDRGIPQTQGLTSGALEPGDSHAFRPPKPGTYRYRSTADESRTGSIVAR